MVSNRKPVLTLLYKEKRRPLHIPVQVCDNLHIPYVEVCAFGAYSNGICALLSFIEVAVRTGIELSEMSVSGTVGTKHGAKVRRFYENTKSFGRKMPAFFFY